MSFWDHLDERSQLALLMAGLVAGAGACDSRTVDPLPSDARVDSLVADMVPPDARVDGVADPLPPDARPDLPVADMLPPDARPDQLVSDMLPPDARLDQLVSDMLPPDASAFSPSPQQRPQQRRAPRLPLSRELRTRIRARNSGPQLQLTAETRGLPSAQVGDYRWLASDGTLDQAQGKRVCWTPPRTPGRYMVQVTVRDGKGAICVDVFVHEVK
jgi:hypothetical protein